MLSKTVCARVRSPEEIPPGNTLADSPSGLAELLPKLTAGITGVKKKLFARISRHSPPTRTFCLPRVQAIDNLAWAHGKNNVRVGGGGRGCPANKFFF